MSNKKKSLLQEGTIRRFMKLAELESLSENFLQDPDINEEEEMDIGVEEERRKKEEEEKKRKKEEEKKRGRKRPKRRRKARI